MCIVMFFKQKTADEKRISDWSSDVCSSDLAARKNLQPLPGLRNIIAVASGKGGVGKSTVAANLALALAAEGARVGLLDADIYGPSQPRMFGVAGKRPTSPDGKRMNPTVAHGIPLMSDGFTVHDAQPMTRRGPNPKGVGEGTDGSSRM